MTAPSPTLQSTLDAAQAGDMRAVGRLCSLVENSPPLGTEDSGEADALLAAMESRGKTALRVGITGPPGAGKSTLIHRALQHFRKEENSPVAVVSVDPTSPRSGGALLGDRLRLTTHQTDPNVFIRSMASRGSSGGFAPRTPEVVSVLEGLGYETILVESVGIGQLAADIAGSVDALLMVLVPESGDAVQMLKAGVLELADLYVINKADRPGALMLAESLAGALDVATVGRERAKIPEIVLISAIGGALEGPEAKKSPSKDRKSDSDGIESLWKALTSFLDAQHASGAFGQRRSAQRRAQVQTLVLEALSARMRAQLLESDEWQRALDQLDAGATTPRQLARQLLSRISDAD